MTRGLNIKSQKDVVHFAKGSKNQPKHEVSGASATTPQRRKFSLSSLDSTAPRTVDDIRRAFAQGRFAELKPEQA